MQGREREQEEPGLKLATDQMGVNTGRSGVRCVWRTSLLRTALTDNPRQGSQIGCYIVHLLY